MTLMCCDSSSNGLTPVNTVRMVVDPTSPPLDLEIQLSSAADILRCGGLVAFPTETVYGLGANALDGQAVARVFVAKGRPQDNPLIVHIACLDDLQAVVAGVPDDALALARAFWPGLSLSFSCARRCCPRGHRRRRYSCGSNAVSSCCHGVDPRCRASHCGAVGKHIRTTQPHAG